MKSKSHKHSIENLITLKWMLGAAMGLVCITTLFNISGHNKLPAIVVSCAVTFGLIFPSAILRLPQFAWKLYAIAIIPLVLIDVLAKETIPALLDLNTWLILFRCLNQTKRREEMQLALLCLFLIIMTGILTATLVFGLQLLIFAAIAVGYLIVGSALESKIEGDYALLEQLQKTVKMDAPAALRSVLNTRFAISSVTVFAFLICLASVVFIAIPRIDVEDKVSLFKMKSPKTMSGFSDHIKLGEVTNIKNDNSIALRVDVPSDAIVPVTPYWRMLALDRYEDGAFSLSSDLSDLQKSHLASPYHTVRYWPNRRFSQVQSEESRDRWTFFLEPEVSEYLPTPGSFKQMTIADLSSLSIGPHMHSFSVREADGKMQSYQLEGIDFSGRVPDVPANSYPTYLSRAGESRRHSANSYPATLLALPDNSKTSNVFQNAAREILNGESPSSLEFARMTNRYLWDRHRYSMSVTLGQSNLGLDPVARWFDSDLPGHCEFFAASFVLTARAAGYPARVAVGFKGGEWNPYEKYFMVSNADAHAWAEIYDGSGYWIRVDPTPGSDSPGIFPATGPVAARYGLSDSSAFLDSLKLLWYRRIVSFDETAQKEAAIQLKDFFVAYVNVAKSWAMGTVSYTKAWAIAPWSVWRVLYMCFLAGLLVSAFIIQRNMALDIRELLMAPFRRGDPIRRKASKVLRKLSVKGLAESEALKKTLSDLQRLRYGSKESWPNPRIVFKTARRIR